MLRCCFLVKGERKRATRDELFDMWDHLVYLHEKGKEQAKGASINYGRGGLKIWAKFTSRF